MLPESARIAVISPSGVFDPVRLEAGLTLLREWGYRPECLPGVGQAWRYLAGSDARRREDLIAALTGDWDAVWMVRGGYGLTRLLADVPWDRVRGTPFFGFSDGTAILNPLVERGFPAIHAPVVQSLAGHSDDATRARVRAVLAGEPTEPLVGRALRRGSAEGSLAGGNLCMLASLCGTPWRFRGKGRIVLLEEVGEVPYRVDRMLTQLISSGAFDGVTGFALGTFLGPVPEGADYTTLEVVTDLLAPLGVPILGELPIGHGPQNYPVRLGSPARIEGDRLVVE